MILHFQISKGDFSLAGKASSEVKKILKKLNVEPKVIKRIVIALYEAEVNIVAHAYAGKIKVNIDSDKIYMRLEDKGPGINDIEQAMQEGYSTATDEVREMGFGAGMGLANMKRNTDKMNISSKLNIGTVVEMTNYLKV